jgi:hypothetical protein
MIMQPPHCTHDADVRRAATSGHPPDPAILAHLADCADCRETFAVAGWMLHLSADTGRMASERDLPDPARIWWRARLLQRWEAETRATAPLDVMQRVEILGGFIALVVLILTLLPELRGFGAASDGASWWPAVARLLAPSGLTTLIISSVLLLGLMAAVTIRQLLVED